MCSRLTLNKGMEKSVVVLGDKDFYSLDSFRVPQCYYGDLECVLVPEGLIRDRAKRLADDIHSSIGDAPITALCVLKGSYRFFATLTEQLSCVRQHCRQPINVEFIRLESYLNTSSGGQVSLKSADVLDELANQNVLVVEDMVDTGKTMAKLVLELNKHNPATVSVVCLFRKRLEKRTGSGYVPDFVGFEIPDKFVVGYGLEDCENLHLSFEDYNQRFRDLNHACVISQSAIAKHALAVGEN